MTVSPSRVAAQIVARLGPPPDDSLPTREELSLTGRIVTLLQQAETDVMEVEEDEFVEFGDDEEEDEEYVFDTDDGWTPPTGAGQVLIGQKYLTKDEVQYLPSVQYDVQFLHSMVKKFKDQSQIDVAYKYRNETKKGPRSLASMMERFRWIKSDHHVRKIIEVAEQPDYIGDRRGLLHLLAKRLREEVDELIDLEGIRYFTIN